jgi:hypothetical protein
MKTLQPITLVTLGPALLGVAQVVAVWLSLPDSRRLADIAWALLVGTGFGLVIFGLIALAVLAGERRPDWVHRYGFCVNWHTSVAMGPSLGYLVASIRHELFDGLAVAAFMIVFLGAVVKVALNEALGQKKQDRT